jgi:hypothetical protein
MAASASIKPSTTAGTSTTSSSQLATMLSAAIHEAESLRRDLALSQRQTAKYERIVNAMGVSSETNGTTVVNGQGASRSQEEMSKLCLEAELRAERAERFVHLCSGLASFA